MNSIDERLIDSIAKLWIIGGGDCDGFDYCVQDIKKRIQEIEKDTNDVRQDSIGQEL